jgi:hypothetical protein
LVIGRKEHEEDGNDLPTSVRTPANLCYSLMVEREW